MWQRRKRSFYHRLLPSIYQSSAESDSKLGAAGVAVGSVVSGASSVWSRSACVACLSSLFVSFSIKQRPPRPPPEINRFVTKGAMKMVPWRSRPRAKAQSCRGLCISFPFPVSSLSPAGMRRCAAAAQRLRKKGNWPFRSLQGPSIRQTGLSFQCGLSNSNSWRRGRAAGANIDGHIIFLLAGKRPT